MRYLEDFSPGQVYRFRSAPMSADSIKAFAEEWDPQRLHTDEANLIRRYSRDAHTATTK